MRFIDTHCHLDFESFHNDLDAVVDRALAQGVYKIIVPGLNLESSLNAIVLAEKFPCIFAAVGVHPSEIQTYTKDQFGKFEKMLVHEKVVAVGEIGLDFFHHSDNHEAQICILKVMLNLAQSAEKPVILHSRQALPALWRIISENYIDPNKLALKGIFHSFEGNLENGVQITEAGFLLGVGGPLTYKNASIKHQLFSKINCKHIVLETDAPFLSPEGFRGKRNEPAQIPVIASKLALLQGRSLNEIAETTTKNANHLFNWIE